MSRKERSTKKTFKVFCEGDTEYSYIDELRRQKKLSIALKMVNMKGGGYRSFLEQVRIDGITNCLAKFIVIDGDRAFSDEGGKEESKSAPGVLYSAKPIRQNSPFFDCELSGL